MSALDLAAAALLDRAADRVLRGWTQGVYARDARGRAVAGLTGDEGRAVCWCAEGALYADPLAYGVAADEAAKALRATIGNVYLPNWNDAPGRTQDEVVAAMRATAARLRGEA